MRISNTLVITSAILLGFSGGETSHDAPLARLPLHSVETTASLHDLAASHYTNVFVLICPADTFDPNALHLFRGCNPFMSLVMDVVASFESHPVMNLRFGVAVASTASPLVTRHRLDATPAVLYARKNDFGDTHLTRYVGDMNDAHLDEMFVTMWARDNAISPLRELNEDNFEHLTQASSGATTGDWLVAFYADDAARNDDDDAAAARLALDTIGAEYKHQLSVALVDVAANPKLAERLKVVLAGRRFAIRYFRLEKMYYFEMDQLNFATLRTFVTGGYRHARAEKVPTEPTPFDQLVESVVTKLKQFGYPSFVGNLILVLAFMAAMSILIILACCASKESKDQDTKFKKG